MDMIQKKICLLGAFAAGKTSLTQRYVNSIFSDKYHTTVGVKIDKKQVDCEGQAYTLMIWDIAGEDNFYNIRQSYLRGMAGYILVIDGTRQNSFEVGMSLFERVKQRIGDLPLVFALNKVDLLAQWTLDKEQLQLLDNSGFPVVRTSAKLDQGVNELFIALVQQFSSRQQGG